MNKEKEDICYGGLKGYGKTYCEMIRLQQENNQLKEQRQELRSWLEEEKNRLARECSQIYEDSLGKTRLVNEDIFNEVNRIILKLNELEGNNENI